MCLCLCALRCSCRSQRTGLDTLTPYLVWGRECIFLLAVISVSLACKFLGILLSLPLIDTHAEIRRSAIPSGFPRVLGLPACVANTLPLSPVLNPVSNLMLVVPEYQCTLRVITFCLVQLTSFPASVFPVQDYRFRPHAHVTFLLWLRPTNIIHVLVCETWVTPRTGVELPGRMGESYLILKKVPQYIFQSGYFMYYQQCMRVPFPHRVGSICHCHSIFRETIKVSCCPSVKVHPLNV